MKQHLRGLNAIRADFAKYESNLYNGDGHFYLYQALENLSELLHTSTNEGDLKVARNILFTYRNKVSEEAAKQRDSDLLGPCYKAMVTFSDYGFDDDPDFIRVKRDLEKEIFDRLLESFCGSRLSEIKESERGETVERFMAYLKANGWKA